MDRQTLWSNARSIFLALWLGQTKNFGLWFCFLVQSCVVTTSSASHTCHVAIVCLLYRRLPDLITFCCCICVSFSAGLSRKSNYGNGGAQRSIWGAQEEQRQGKQTVSHLLCVDCQAKPISFVYCLDCQANHIFLVFVLVVSWCRAYDCVFVRWLLCDLWQFMASVLHWVWILPRWHTNTIILSSAPLCWSLSEWIYPHSTYSLLVCVLCL